MDPAERRELNDSVARLAAGDRSAFTFVFARLRPMVFAFCRRALADSDMADDVAQLALLKVFERAATYDPTRDAVTWVLAVTAWECKTARRQASRQRIDRDASVREESEGASPEESLLDALDRRALEEAVRELGPVDRETLLGTLDESASGATFRKRRQRALARLREVWKRRHEG